MASVVAPTTQLRQSLVTALAWYDGRHVAGDHLHLRVLNDTAADRYSLLLQGWEDRHPVARCVAYIELIDDKIWIQFDKTEHGLAADLVRQGVSAEQIVLGFQTPERRAQSGFATG